MQHRPLIFRNIILPMMILIPLIGIMVGCIYIPTWERVDLGGTRHDFRPIVNATAKNPLSIGNTTRADIEKVLGPPPFSTLDGHRVVYVIEARRGFWTAPLCFFLVDRYAHTEQIGLDIAYRPDGILSNYLIIKREVDQGPPGIVDDWGDPFGGPTGERTTIVNELNQVPELKFFLWVRTEDHASKSQCRRKSSSIPEPIKNDRRLTQHLFTLLPDRP